MTSKPTVYRLLILLVIAASLLAACGGTPTSTAAPLTTVPSGNSGGSPVNTQAPAYPAATNPQAGYPAPGAAHAPIQIVTPDGKTLSLSDAELSNVVTTDVTANGQSYSGFPLSTILMVAGISNYTQVIITGASNSVTLAKDKLGADTVIAYSDQGKPELVSGTLAAEQWVKDITKIEVK